MTSAQVEYATILYLGKGVPADRVAAAKWYGRAAEAGNPVAQNRYAKLLAVGEGVAPSLEDAAMYRALARRQGLKDPQLDKLLVAATPEEIARAEERARFWPSAPPTKVAAATPPALAPDKPAAN
jgi:TPR repeat protein